MQLPCFSPALFTLQETTKLSKLWKTYQEKITKTQAHLTAFHSLADNHKLLGQCTNMAHFNEIHDFFNLQTFEEIEKHITKVKVGYAVAQALDTAGVPFHKDLKGTFPMVVVMQTVPTVDASQCVP